METIIKALPISVIIGFSIPLFKLIFSDYRDRIHFTKVQTLLRDLVLTSIFNFFICYCILDLMLKEDFLTKDGWKLFLAFYLLTWGFSFICYQLTYKFYEKRRFYTIEINEKKWYAIRALNKDEILLHAEPSKEEVSGLQTMTISRNDLLNKPMEYYLKPRKQKS